METRAPEVFFEGPEDEHRRKLALIIREILSGKTNNAQVVTLAPGESETRIERDRVSMDTVVLLTPKSATAAAAIAAGSLWVETTVGRLTIHHDATADTDRIFGAVFVG